jgi:hypothetical protein
MKSDLVISEIDLENSNETCSNASKLDLSPNSVNADP